MKIVVKIFKTIPGLDWLPGDVSLCRTHHCRQGLDVSCGYYVCWFVEEELRRSLGDAPFSRGFPNVDGQIARLEALVKNVLPVEKKLQIALKSTAWIAETRRKRWPWGVKPSLEIADKSPSLEIAAKTTLEAAMEDLAATVLEKKDLGDVPGVDVAFPIAAYGGDVAAWATDVVAVLSEEHQKLVEKVREKDLKMGCLACRYTSCVRCWWPKTVRYWRRVETGSKHAHVEGYDRLMKAPTAMKLGD